MTKESSRLTKLRRERDRLNREIASLEEAAEEKRKLETLERHYVRVVCQYCQGTQERVVGGADIISDPPMTFPCDDCEYGWVWARKWEGEVHHDMEFDERVGWG